MDNPSGPRSSGEDDPNSTKLALAMALLRFKKLHSVSSPGPDALRWKRKAKDRKRELQRLREELKQLEDGMQCESVPEIAACRCHFFDGCGELGDVQARSGGGEHWIDEVLRRRFLRLVRLKERRKRSDGSKLRRGCTDLESEDDIDRLTTSTDFLVELVGLNSVNHDSSFHALSHQAIDFILASLKNLLASRKDSELIEEIVNGLIMRLTRRMCTITGSNESVTSGPDAQFYVQHLIRKLGSEPFVGQHTLLSLSQKISIQAETLLLMDPFDDGFPGAHDSMFMMIQLIELLISDYLQTWTSNDEIDWRVCEEWLRSVLQARKALSRLESSNGLYMLYIERVTGELAKLMGPLASQGKLEMDILSDLFS